MRFVKPMIFLTAQTRPNKAEIEKWLLYVGCDPITAKRYADGEGKTSSEQLIELYGRRCYMSFEVGLNPNVQKIREDIRDYIDNVLASKHGSILEHVMFTFSIEGVSRVFTGEMNRHRAGVAISEGSMRYIRFNDIPIVDVPSIQNDEDMYLGEDSSIWSRKKTTRHIIERIVLQIESSYDDLVTTWRDALEAKADFKGKKSITSMLRRIVPMGVATGGAWTFNIRALRHMITMRVSKAAEEEILVVASMMLKRMMEEEPILFGDFSQDEEGTWKPKYDKV